jgi:hypothetical protein
MLKSLFTSVSVNSARIVTATLHVSVNTARIFYMLTRIIGVSGCADVVVLYHMPCMVRTSLCVFNTLYAVHFGVVEHSVELLMDVY